MMESQAFLSSLVLYNSFSVSQTQWLIPILNHLYLIFSLKHYSLKSSCLRSYVTAPEFYHEHPIQNTHPQLSCLSFLFFKTLLLYKIMLFVHFLITLSLHLYCKLRDSQDLICIVHHNQFACVLKYKWYVIKIDFSQLTN